MNLCVIPVGAHQLRHIITNVVGGPTPGIATRFTG